MPKPYIEIRLKDYLKIEEAHDLQKPKTERRDVPSITELAEASGLSLVAFSRMINAKTPRLLNMGALALTIQELRRRGFHANIGNLLVYHEGEEGEGKP